MVCSARISRKFGDLDNYALALIKKRMGSFYLITDEGNVLNIVLKLRK